MTREVRRQLAAFLERWFGIHDDLSSSPADTVGPLLTHNHRVAEELDGHVEVLVAEQQGVWLWGRTSDGRFVERENEPGVAWRELDEDEDGFWLHHAAFEAATNLAASRSAQLFDAPAVAAIRDEVTPLPCGSWTWPGATQAMFHRGASVVMICEDGDDFWVVASAPSEHHLEWLDALGLDWDEVDTRRTAGS